MTNFETATFSFTGRRSALELHTPYKAEEDGFEPSVPFYKYPPFSRRGPATNGVSSSIADREGFEPLMLRLGKEHIATAVVNPLFSLYFCINASETRRCVCQFRHLSICTDVGIRTLNQSSDSYELGWSQLVTPMSVCICTGTKIRTRN